MRNPRPLLATLVLLAIPACGGSAGGGDASGVPSGDDFAAFVKARIDDTEDAAEPVPLNGRTFTNVASQDDTLFNDVLLRYADRSRKPDAP